MTESPTRKPGRPASGPTKLKTSVSIDAKILKRAKTAAYKEGLSLSALIEKAVRQSLSPSNP